MLLGNNHSPKKNIRLVIIGWHEVDLLSLGTWMPRLCCCSAVQQQSQLMLCNLATLQLCQVWEGFPKDTPACRHTGVRFHTVSVCVCVWGTASVVLYPWPLNYCQRRISNSPRLASHPVLAHASRQINFISAVKLSTRRKQSEWQPLSPRPAPSHRPVTVQASQEGVWKGDHLYLWFSVIITVLLPLWELQSVGGHCRFWGVKTQRAVKWHRQSFGNTQGKRNDSLWRCPCLDRDLHHKTVKTRRSITG